MERKRVFFVAQMGISIGLSRNLGSGSRDQGSSTWSLKSCQDCTVPGAFLGLVTSGSDVFREMPLSWICFFFENILMKNPSSNM